MTYFLCISEKGTEMEIQFITDLMVLIRQQLTHAHLIQEIRRQHWLILASKYSSLRQGSFSSCFRFHFCQLIFTYAFSGCGGVEMGKGGFSPENCLKLLSAS